jgi:predicted nuclease of restriction endonuclease-like (RecB) superfamily
MKPELTLYHDLLGDIKMRVRQAQHRAAISANAEMIFMYWEIGRMIAERQKLEGWGASVIPRLATDLKNELPEQKGFSERNIKRMVQFWAAYPQLLAIGPPSVAHLEETTAPVKIRPPSVAQSSPSTAKRTTDHSASAILQKAVTQLSWVHNIVLLQLKNPSTRLWYAQPPFGKTVLRMVLVPSQAKVYFCVYR